MRIKIFMTVSIDPEEYPIPADGKVSEEIEEAITEYFYDIEGANIKSIKTVME